MGQRPKEVLPKLSMALASAPASNNSSTVGFVKRRCPMQRRRSTSIRGTRKNLLIWICWHNSIPRSDNTRETLLMELESFFSLGDHLEKVKQGDNTLGNVVVQVNAGMLLKPGMCSRSALREHMICDFKTPNSPHNLQQQSTQTNTQRIQL